MSKHNRPRLSLSGDRNESTTAPIEPPPAETKRPMQEKPMPPTEEQAPQKWVGELNQSQAPQGLTANQDAQTDKQRAAVEEENMSRIIRQQQAQALRAERDAAVQDVSIIGAAAQGREYLLEQMRAHQGRNKPIPYVPPPMTARQRSVLEEEMAAGARRVATAEAQKIVAGHPVLPPPKDNNEGLTNPVHRPNEVVPDPMLTGTGKSGFKGFSPDV